MASSQARARLTLTLNGKPSVRGFSSVIGISSGVLFEQVGKSTRAGGLVPAMAGGSNLLFLLLRSKKARVETLQSSDRLIRRDRSAEGVVIRQSQSGQDTVQGFDQFRPRRANAGCFPQVQQQLIETQQRP
jgi:hypothetical protein